MPQFTGRLRTPRLPGAPTSPAAGEMYYDDTANVLYWWNGSTWTPAGGGSAEVNISTGGPSPRVGELLWVDTDATSPPATIPLYTTMAELPTSPVDGQECFFRHSGFGALWHLRWRAGYGDAYGWEFVGGMPMKAVKAGAAVLSGQAQNNWAHDAASGLDMSPPLGGIYDWRCGATVTPASISTIYLGATINAADPNVSTFVDGNCSFAYAATAGQPVNLTAANRMTMIAGFQGIQVRLRHNAGASQNLTRYASYLEVIPVRLGRV